MSSHGVAFVTGASQGIGKAIALRLAADGFDIAVNDIPAGKEKLDALSREIVEKGGKTCILLGDVSVERDVEDMINAVVEQMGRLDVVSSVSALLFFSLLILTHRWLRMRAFVSLNQFLRVCFNLPLENSDHEIYSTT